MQLPIDIVALINEMTNIKAARETELSVSMYIDGEAPADLIGHVRATFASVLPTVRMTISYLDDTFFPHSGDDFAVLVAGASSSVGAACAAIRGIGVPVMVVTTLPETVIANAERMGHSIPDGDVVSPALVEEDEEAEVEREPEEEPIALDAKRAEVLDDRMGAWVVSVCKEKRLAFSIAFPFMRRALANDSVQATSLQNAGISLIPLIPGADLPVLTLNQAKMVLQIAAAYDHEMDMERVKEIALVVGGAYLCRTLARELVEFIPFLGFLVRSGVAYGGTAAMGYALIEYYEGGESAKGVANVATSAASAGSRFVSFVKDVTADPSKLKTSKIGEALSNARGRSAEFAPKLAEVAGELAPGIAEKANDLTPKLVDAANKYAPKFAGTVEEVAPKLTGKVGEAAPKLAEKVADLAPKLAGIASK